VRQALARYIEAIRGSRCATYLSRAPSLGDLVVAELTTEQLRKWFAIMAAAPPQSRLRPSRFPATQLSGGYA
jgi:hypothetical protein